MAPNRLSSRYLLLWSIVLMVPVEARKMPTRQQDRNAPTGYPGQRQQDREVPVEYQGSPAQSTEMQVQNIGLLQQNRNAPAGDPATQPIEVQNIGLLQQNRNVPAGDPAAQPIEVQKIGLLQQNRNEPAGDPAAKPIEVQNIDRNAPAEIPAQTIKVQPRNIRRYPGPGQRQQSLQDLEERQQSLQVPAAQTTEVQPHNIFEQGKGNSKKKGSKSSSKSGSKKGKSGKGKKKSKANKKGMMAKGKGPVDVPRLVFEPEEFPAGVLTEISVALSSRYYQTTACVDFYQLFRIDSELGAVLVTTLVRTRQGSRTFGGTFEVLSTFPGEFFSFRAIPVIDHIPDPRSKLVVTTLEALRSFGGGGGGVPTMSPATAAPITSTPTRAPVTARPTVLITATPTRAPVTATPTLTRAPATAIPTGNPTRMPAAPDTPTRSPAGDPVFEQLLVIQGAPEAQFGRTVALSGDGSILAAGAPFNNEFGFEAGRVGLYQIVGNTANILFDFSGAQVGLRVGQALSMSTGSPPILAIGGTDFVDVYPISQFLNGGGGEDPPVLEFDRFEADFIDEDYGTAIAMSGDGARLAAGAPRAFIGAQDVGQVQIYEIGGVQIGVEILGLEGNDFFGSAVTLSEDGLIVGVGAITGSSGAGYVRVFNQNGENWDQVGQTIVGRQPGDNLGKALSISADGQTVAIGAYQADTATGSGYVQIYELVGTTWTQIGADIVGPNSGDRFGFSVALTPDASVLTIGANANDSGGFTNNGLVQVYENQSGTWVQTGGDIIGNADSRNLGVGVAISSDGKTIAAGGPLSTAAVDTNIGEASVYFLT
jgi:hypothetical protein